MQHRAVLQAMLVLFTFRVGGGNAYSQRVELSAGASNAEDAQGASVHWQSHNMESHFGLGLSHGRFGAGGAVVRTFSSGSITLGEQELKANLPTDIFDTNHTLFGTGVGVQHTDASGSLTAFTGFTSLRNGTPFFQAQELGAPTHFAQWKAKLGSSCNQTATALNGSSRIALFSVDCAPSSWLSLAGTSGFGAGRPYVAASMVLHTRGLVLKTAYISASSHFERNSDAVDPTPEPLRANVGISWDISAKWKLTAGHGNWTTSSLNKAVVSDKSGMDDLGIAWENNRVSASAVAIRSSFSAGNQDGQSSGTTDAFSGALRYRARRLEIAETVLHAQGSTGVHSTIASTTASLDMGARLRVSESVNATPNGVSFSHGGSLLTRWSSFDLDYQFYYVANRPDRPFQQALLARADLQLPGRFKLSVSSNVSASGMPLYSFQVGRTFVHDHNATGTSLTFAGGTLLHGHVEEPTGSPVPRAAIMIGKDRVYSDDSGDFLWRGPRSTVLPLRVLTAEFVSAYIYTVVEAPSQVRTGDDKTLRIVVRREARDPSRKEI